MGRFTIKEYGEWQQMARLKELKQVETDVKDSQDKISILNEKVKPEAVLNTTSQNLTGAINEIKGDLDEHKEKYAQQQVSIVNLNDDNTSKNLSYNNDVGINLGLATEGDLFYISVEAKLETSIPSDILVKYHGVTLDKVADVSSNYSLYSFFVEYKEGKDQDVFFKRSNGAIKCRINNCVNVSQSLSQGGELTKEECDSVMSDYFEGIKFLYPKDLYKILFKRSNQNNLAITKLGGTI